VSVFEGRLIAIHVAAAKAERLSSVAWVQAVAGQGLEGDRYSKRAGTYSKKHHPGREVTLIESEAIEAAARDKKLSIEPRDTRRNLLTQGVPLNHLIGVRFRVGEVLLEGVELCDPCGHMETLSGAKGAKDALANRGGLRARILESGRLRVGDPIDKNTDIGAINSKEQLDRIRTLSDIGESEGAVRWSAPCWMRKSPTC